MAYPVFSMGGCLHFFLVLVGFARTYYLRLLFGLPHLEPLLHLHGLLMTGWFVLFFVQIVLVKRRRLDIHRRTGWFGLALMAGIVLLPLIWQFAARYAISP